MEVKENASLRQAKSNVTKIVALVLRPDGKAQVKTFERESELPQDFNLNGATVVSSKDFDSIPKRLEFFFEKGFKGV